jgi:hypothetical protein
MRQTVTELCDDEQFKLSTEKMADMLYGNWPTVKTVPWETGGTTHLREGRFATSLLANRM